MRRARVNISIENVMYVQYLSIVIVKQGLLKKLPAAAALAGFGIRGSITLDRPSIIHHFGGGIRETFGKLGKTSHTKYV